MSILLFNAFSYKRLEKVLKSKMRLAPIDVAGCIPQITGWIDPQPDRTGYPIGVSCSALVEKGFTNKSLRVRSGDLFVKPFSTYKK